VGRCPQVSCVEPVTTDAPSGDDGWYMKRRYTPKKPIAAHAGNIAKLAIHYKDWEYAEQQFRTGTKSVSVIADEIGVPKEHLFDHFAKEKVSKDLGSAIQSRTMDMLAANALPQNAVLPVSDEDIISINATLQSSLILRHREDISRARRIVMQIMSELEYQTDNQVVLQDLGTILASPDDKGVDKLKDIYDKIISMPGRVDSIKKLGESLKVLIMLERQAFGIRDDYEDPRVKMARMVPEGQQSDTGFAALSERFNRIANRNSVTLAEDAVVLSEKTA